MLWTPAANWEARVIVTGERARDGDYALNDLGALRAKPFHAARDFEGFTHRDIVAPTVLVRHDGAEVDVSRRPGFVWWKTGTTHRSRLLADPARHARQRRARSSVHAGGPARVREGCADRGLRRRDAEMAGRRVRVHPGLRAGRRQQLLARSCCRRSSTFRQQHSPQSTLDDRGIGVYGQGTFTVRRQARRHDRRARRLRAQGATLDTFFDPPIAPPRP